MQQARLIKTQDEITLLNTACMMVDAAYDELYRAMKPGIRENECVALVSKVLYDMGSEHVEGVNAISGERCSPHPHVFSDRALRPGDPAYFDILHSYNGYRTCYYRTFAIGSASQAMVDAYKRCRDILDVAINAIKPGVTTADIVKLWPKAEEFGFPNSAAAGDDVPVGKVIATILAPEEGSPADKSLVDKQLSTWDGATPLPQVEATRQVAIAASPLASRIAAEHNVDLSQVKSAGKRIQTTHRLERHSLDEVPRRGRACFIEFSSMVKASKKLMVTAIIAKMVRPITTLWKVRVFG